VEKTYEEAMNIYKEINNLKKEFDSVEKRVYELNKRLPSKYESINLGYPRWWDIA
jgi:Tfp pilus assembly protein PilO